MSVIMAILQSWECRGRHEVLIALTPANTRPGSASSSLLTVSHIPVADMTNRAHTLPP